MSTFRPDEKELASDKLLAMLISIFAMGYGTVAAQVFNSARYASLVAKGNGNKGAIKDSIAAMSAGAFAIGPRYIKGAQEKGVKQNGCKEQLSIVIDKWREAIRDAAQYSLNPESMSRALSLGDALKDGKWPAAKDGNDLLGMNNIVRQVLTATMVYDMWKLNGKRYPVIINTEVNCGDKHKGAPSKNDKFEEDNNLYRYMSKDFASKHKVCVEGKSFYVGMYETGWSWTSIATGSSLRQRDRIAGQQHWVKELPGWSDLTPGDLPWKMGAEDLVLSV